MVRLSQELCSLVWQGSVELCKLTNGMIRKPNEKAHRLWRVCALALAVCLIARSHAGANDFQGATHLMPFDEDTIGYSKAKDTSPVARLQERIDRGEVKLSHDERFGYLPALLKALNVDTNSQMLV